MPSPPEKPPVANGEPGTDVSEPVPGLITKELTLPLPSLATNSRFPTTHVVMRFVAKNPLTSPAPPVKYGEPGSSTKDPEPVTENAETVFGPAGLLFTYTKSCA